MAPKSCAGDRISRRQKRKSTDPGNTAAEKTASEPHSPPSHLSVNDFFSLGWFRIVFCDTVFYYTRTGFKLRLVTNPL